MSEQINHAVTGFVSVSVRASATASVRANLSVTHILSAALFSRNAGSIESAHAGQAFGEFWEDIQSNSIASVLTSVAALEAYANELFVDYAKVFPELRLEVMAKLWELYEQKPILEKYEFALILRQGPAFDRGAPLYRDISALIKLRNALTHYKPEWSHEQAEHAKVSGVIKGKACASPFFPPSESLFPRAWASHGSTQWSVRSVVSFILDFEKRSGIESRFAPFVERLSKI